MLYKTDLLHDSEILDENQPVLGFQRYCLSFSHELATNTHFISSLELCVNPALY